MQALRMFASSVASALLVGIACCQTGARPPEVHGRVETHQGLKLLRVWGTPHERGYAHGSLLAKEFAAMALTEFAARFARKQPLLQQARAAVGRLIEYPADVQQELDGLWQGLVDSKVDLQMPELERAFDKTDLLIANALDVFGLMGCSSFTVWGERVDGGGVLTARNFDWPLTGPHMLDHTIVVVQHFADGKAVASVSWPGYVGTVTGVSSDGMAAFLHVGTGAITYTPEPSSWPTAVAARALLAAGVCDRTAMLARGKDLLGYTSPPAGFLTHVVLPVVPADGTPALVFETDAKKCVPATAGAGCEVLTNHFRTRTDGRTASKDSVDREQSLQKGIAGCIEVADKKVSVAEAWDVLATVDRGGKRGFGTLHALVFRHEPWCFELRVGETKDSGLVAAPVSSRQYVLSRAELFAPDERFGR
ncbi:MAG: hypothetical protein JNK15_18330 [Planctomycetes bacterium]|nr:hypothetical protein [Planctomycetota bacterium]